jgi:hypothetical protein
LIVVPLLLLALGLRLNEMQGQSLWLDEAVEFNVAARPLPDVVEADRSSTHDPPLFSLALSLWLHVSNSDFYARFLPVMASVLAVAGLYVLGRVVFSTPVGWFSALLAAVAPRAVFYGFELNQYALIFLLTVLGTLLLERYLRSPNKLRLAAFLLVSSAALFTHYELVFYWIALILVGTFALIVPRGALPRRRLVPWFSGLAVLASIGLILLGTYALPQKARLPETYAPARFLNGPVVLSTEVETWVAQTGELMRTLLWGTEPAPLAWLTASLLIVGTLVCLFHSGRRLALYFITSLALAYFMAGVGFLVYWFRYVWYAFPLAVLLICGGVFALAGGRYRRYLMPVAYLLMSILAILLFSRLPAISGKPFPETEQFSEVMKYFQPRYQDGDAIYVYYATKPAFTRYGTETLLKAAIFQVWSRGIAPEKQQADLWNAVGNTSRVWLLISHGHPSDASVLLEALQGRCQQTDALEVTGAAGYLFDCATP